jgi:hypothetical protein
MFIHYLITKKRENNRDKRDKLSENNINYILKFYSITYIFWPRWLFNMILKFY